ncbi:sigma factor [Micromonospora sp. NPDC050397]|uniref:sigma factor n=1 Tax=Micromonospora sp. NPDC050397 TaxID=3364279 RepID=UPI00385147A0
MQTSARAEVTFDAVYAAHYVVLVRLAYVTTGSQQVAEDVVQEVFIEWLRRMDAVRDPVPYLRRAVVSRCRAPDRRPPSAGAGSGRRVDRLQLATGLLGEVRVAEVGDVDRGPRPRWWITLVVAATALTGYACVRAVLAVRRRAPRPPVDPAGTAAPTSGTADPA